MQKNGENTRYSWIGTSLLAFTMLRSLKLSVNVYSWTVRSLFNYQNENSVSSIICLSM